MTKPEFTVEHKVSKREWEEISFPAEWFLENFEELLGDDWEWSSPTFHFEKGNVFTDEGWGVRQDKLWTSSYQLGIVDWSEDKQQYIKSYHFSQTELGNLVSVSLTLKDDLREKLGIAKPSNTFDEELKSFLNDFTCHAEGGFLDEIPSFKPDCYYHPLVKQAAQLLIKLDPDAFDEYTKKLIQ